MKYTVGVLGLLLVSSCVWAEPETMTMYSTLSAPMGSFWKVETASCNPVVMPSNSQLNLGQVATGGSAGSSGGAIVVQGTKPISIAKLRMEKGTKLQVSNNARWMVSTLKIAPKATFNLQGNLVANELELTNINESVTINAHILRLGRNAKITNQIKIDRIQTGKCGADNFCLEKDEDHPASATWTLTECTSKEKEEGGSCAASSLLVGE